VANGRPAFPLSGCTPAVKFSGVMMRFLFLAVLTLAGAGAGADPAGAPPHPGVPASRVLHTRFDADRVYVILRTRNGDSLELYSDTGGGMLLTAAAAQRAGLTVETATDSAAAEEFGPGGRFTNPPQLAPGEPAPGYPAGARVAVVPRMAEIPAWPTQGDGLLGQAWFAGHEWTWDYPGQRLILRPADWRPAGTAPAINVGFRSEDGRRVLNFPRIVVSIDGDSLSMLLDTGAETMLTPGALRAMQDGGPAFRATSMIEHSIFARWQRRHPDWPVVDSAQVATGSRMIRVPSVRIGGVATGPVWFTERSDANYAQYMSAMTDQPVQGSIGGNAFAELEMTVDYASGRAWFVCRGLRAGRRVSVRGCSGYVRSRRQP
jgi:hypothetical protein